MVIISFRVIFSLLVPTHEEMYCDTLSSTELIEPLSIAIPIKSPKIVFADELDKPILFASRVPNTVSYLASSQPVDQIRFSEVAMRFSPVTLASLIPWYFQPQFYRP